MDGKKNEKELKALTQTIMEVLTHNEEIVSLLLDLKARNVIDSSTLLGLALKVSDLVEVSGAAFSQEDLGRKDQPEKAVALKSAEAAAATVAKERAVIDGRDLTPSEAAFQEWTTGKFDEKDWLKKTGLIY